MKHFQILLIAFLFSTAVRGQVNISGTVYHNHAPLSGAIIKLYLKKDTTTNLIDFFITKLDGRYQFMLQDSSSFYFVNVSCPGFASRDSAISNLKHKKQIDFYLTRDKSYLDTVKVNTVFKFRISNDTITFNPRAYALKNERTLEEALSRLPGITIDDKGVINFNGTVISKVLIEGDDLFQKNYQELTKNASPEMIERVEIIKNYQKDKILKEQNITDGQIINLTLNKEYKKSFFGYVNGGYGIEHQKKAEAFAINLKEKLKAQSRIGYNNLGFSSAFAENNLTAQMLDNNQRFPVFKAVKPYVETDRYFAPQIPLFYQQQNRTTELINNSVFKLNRGYEMKLNIRSTTDKIYQQQTKLLQYFNGVNISRSNSLQEEVRTQKLLLEGNRLSDKKSLYFNFGIERSPQKDYLNTTQEFAFKQFLRTENDLLYGNVNYNTKRSNRLWMHSFGTYFQRISQNYFIDSGVLYWKTPPDFNKYSVNPNVYKSILKQYWKMQVAIAKNKVRHEFTSMFISDYEKLNSDLKSSPSIMNGFAGSFINDLPVLSLNGNLKYILNYFLTSKISSAFTVAQGVNYFNFIKKERRYLFYLPEYSIDTKYKSSSSGEFSFSLRRQEQIHSTEEFFDSALFSNYNTIRYGYYLPYSYTNSSFSLSHAYLSLTNNGHWFSFFNGRVSFFNDRYALSTLVGNAYSVQQFQYFPNNTREFFLLHTLQRIMLKPSLQISSSLVFRNKSQYYFNNGLLYLSNVISRSVNLTAKSTFNSVFNGEVFLSFSQNNNNLQIPKLIKNKFFNNSQKMTMYAVFSKTFFLSASLNRLYLSTNRNGYNLFDVSVTAKFFKEKFLLELNGRNLFNEKRFEIYSINPIFAQFYTFTLRGREAFFLLKYNFK